MKMLGKKLKRSAKPNRKPLNKLKKLRRSQFERLKRSKFKKSNVKNY